MTAGLSLLRQFLRSHPAEIAEELERIDAHEAAAVLADSPPEEAAPALAWMGAMAAAAALEAMEVPSAVALVCRLESPLAAMLLRRLTLPARQNVLFVCPDPWKTAITAAMAAPPGSVAAIMDARAPVFPADWQASDLVDYMAAHPGRLALDAFVTGRSHRLEGRVELRALEGRTGARELRGVMAPNPPCLAVRAAIRSLRDDPLWQKLDVLPVVDETGIFAGALSHRALRAAGKPEPSPPSQSAGSAFVEFAELAWTGYAAALDVASSLTRNLVEGDEPSHAQED